MKDPVERANARAAEGYVYTDIYEEAIDSLEMTARFLEESETDPRRWKWVIIALNTAIQNFMVLALKGSWDVATQHRDVRSEKLTANLNYRKAVESGDEEAIAAARAKDIEMMFTNQLNGFEWLYALIKDKDHWAMRHLGNDEAFVPGNTCDESMKMLKHLRDDYMHFPSSTRFHDVANLAQIAVDGLTVIDFLMGRDRLIGWRPDNEHKLRAAVAYTIAEASATRLAERYPLPPEGDSAASDEPGLTFGQMLQRAIESMTAEDNPNDTAA